MNVQGGSRAPGASGGMETATEMGPMKVPFLDLRVTDPTEKAALIAAVGRVFDHGRIILGPEVEEFERALVAQVGRKHVVGVGSGTDAVILALRAIGLGRGDEVITTPLSFIATANAIRIVGATPVFADIDNDLNLDPATIEPLITSRTRAIVAVHWAGLVCRMDEIRAIAEKHGLLLAEDCAQAFGATRGGKPLANAKGSSELVDMSAEQSVSGLTAGRCGRARPLGAP